METFNTTPAVQPATASTPMPATVNAPVAGKPADVVKPKNNGAPRVETKSGRGFYWAIIVLVVAFAIGYAIGPTGWGENDTAKQKASLSDVAQQEEAAKDGLVISQPQGKEGVENAVPSQPLVLQNAGGAKENALVPKTNTDAKKNSSVATIKSTPTALVLDAATAVKTKNYLDSLKSQLDGMGAEINAQNMTLAEAAKQLASTKAQLEEVQKLIAAGENQKAALSVSAIQQDLGNTLSRISSINEVRRTNLELLGALETQLELLKGSVGKSSVPVPAAVV